MSNVKISALFKINSRFLRSAHLERDFKDDNVLKEYVLSDFSQNCLIRIAKGLENNSGHRAWRITGDYGTGKSSFALYLSHWFSGNINKLPSNIKKSLKYKQISISKPQFIPILITGSRTPLGPAILMGLYDCLDNFHLRGKKTKTLLELENLVKYKTSVSDEEIIRLILDANRYIILSGKGVGLLIIIDELGKFLEFASLYPEKQDIYLLQRIADTASRSEQKPFFIIGLLHQGFNAYASQLSQAGQRELEKVAGRFEELIFNQPIEQTAILISSALKVQTKKLPKYHLNTVKNDMEETIKFGWFGSAPAKNTLLKNVLKMYPIHPTVLPVLVRIFSRFAQNERSLFSFLLSNEPFSLQSFAENNHIAKGCYYRLNDLYDYVKFNFGYRLSVKSYRNHWNHIESMIDSFSTNSELELKLLKTVGIINLINQNDLLATEQSILIAFSNSSYTKKEIRKSLEILKKKRHVLYHRGAAGGYCLWPHTSVDLDLALENAEKVIGTPKNISKIVKNYIDPSPIVARRHYIQTGNLRHFQLYYCSVSDLPSTIDKFDGEADGAILIPLCENNEERKRALKSINNSKLKKNPNILIAIPKQLNILSGLILEAQKWEWIARNTPELEADRFAAKEVSLRINFSKSSLLKQINSFIGLRQFSGQFDLELYQKGNRLNVSSGRELLSLISDICDRVYSKAPRIKNELVNRQNLSPAAAAARMRLIEKILSGPDKPFLGMEPNKKPPEMSVYLSVLKKSMLHQNQGDSWMIALPDKKSDTCNVLQIFECVKKIIKNKPDKKIPVSYLYVELKKRPYGVREGLIPIFLSVFKVIYEHEIAFYEDGSFLRIVGAEEFQRLIKSPNTFEIQYCKIEGIRTDIYNKIISALGLKNANKKEPELLDIVQPICIFAANLPKYVHNTKKLTIEALTVRDVIMSAHEPVKLLFIDLPKACGIGPFDTKDKIDNKKIKNFVRALKRALNELKMAYPELEIHLRQQLQESFNISGPFEKFRKSVCERAERIALNISEPKLKVFCLRLMDENLPNTEWIESIGSYLSSKPPEKWNDIDENIFNQELANKTNQFIRVESTLFTNTSLYKNCVGMRFALTRSDGNEQENVIYISPEEEIYAKKLQKDIDRIIKKHKNVGIAATFKALWDNLARERK